MADHRSSWHLSISGAYLPAWIGIAIIFQHFVFKNTNLGLLIGAYLITGLSLASWTQLVVVWFKDASTLAAIFSKLGKSPPSPKDADSIATFLAIVFNLIAVFMRAPSPGLAILLTFLFPPMFFTWFTKSIIGWERSNPLKPMRLNRISPEGDAPIGALLAVAIVSALRSLVWE